MCGKNSTFDCNAIYDRSLKEIRFSLLDENSICFSFFFFYSSYTLRAYMLLHKQYANFPAIYRIITHATLYRVSRHKLL